MHRSIRRILTGLCALAVSAGALGSATPAQASEAPSASRAWDILVTEDALAYSSPRLNTAVTARLQAGTFVPAFCILTNAGSEWVKVFADDAFGYVPSTSVEEGAGALPRQCPSELDTITLPAHGLHFTTPAWGVPFNGFTCPARFPYLDGRVRFRWTPFVDYIQNWTIPGVQVERASTIGIMLGVPIPVAAPNGGDPYLGGYGDGTMTNSVEWSVSAKLTATCTSNAAYAVLAPR